MKIFPAVDLKNGEAVRLQQGDYNKVKVYFKNPIEVLDFFLKNKSENLHIVDLDGASSGKTENFSVIKELVDKSDFFIQVGGGIRNEEIIEKYLNIGVNRVILGTAAVENLTFLEEMIKKYKEKIAVSIDCKNEKVAVKGWKEVKDINSVDFCVKLSELGVQTIIYTDISKDGELSGTNLEIYKSLAENKKIKSDIIASGGITFENEIEYLKNLGIYGAIVGKAIYEEALDLKKIIEATEK